MAYKGIDFYNCDELFTEEEILIRDSVRQFVTDQLMPVINEDNREGTFPAHLVPGLGELGVLGASLEGYGCAGVSATAYGLMMVELERSPAAWAALTISSQRCVISRRGATRARSVSSRISAAVPGIVPSPASFSQVRYSPSDIPLFLWPKWISSGEKA